MLNNVLNSKFYRSKTLGTFLMIKKINKRPLEIFFRSIYNGRVINHGTICILYFYLHLLVALALICYQKNFRSILYEIIYLRQRNMIVLNI
jgi:hypothetical protein